jgi:surface carbohydrate biosynthesis protein
MYSQRYEIPALAPDLVLVNYVRKANRNLIKAYKSAGIRIGVVDTEGGVWESDRQFVDSIDSEALSLVDLYFVWGRAQKEALQKLAGFPAEKIFLTGCQRFDFYQPYLRAAMQFEHQDLKPFVLFTTSFALAYPRFSTVQKESQSMIDCGYSKELVSQKLADETACRAAFVEMLHVVLGKFPNLNFVIRAHPFEDESEYSKIISNHANLKVIRSGVVGNWLNEAGMVCHFNSSIAIESYLLGRPAYALDWMNTRIIREMSPVTLGISYKLNSRSELEKKLTDISNNKDLTGQGLDASAADLLNSWIYMQPHGAAPEIREVIDGYLQKNKFEVDPEKCRQMAFYGSLSKHSLRGWVEGLGRVTFSPGFFEFLRNWILTKNIGKGTRIVKRFDKKMIDKVLRNIERALQTGETIRSEPATNQDAVVFRMISGSYKIKVSGKD